MYLASYGVIAKVELRKTWLVAGCFRYVAITIHIVITVICWMVDLGGYIILIGCKTQGHLWFTIGSNPNWSLYVIKVHTYDPIISRW